MRPIEELHDEQYLGDGVYVGHDGYHIVLWLQGHGAFGPGTIALEPPLLRRLDQYRATLAERTTDTEEASDGSV